MLKDIQSKFVVISFLFAFVLYFGLPIESNAQAPEFGCCDVSGGSGNCQPGESWPQPNASMENCEQAPGPTKEWLPFDLCVQMQGGPQCVPANGCCAVPGSANDFICTDSVNAVDCQTPGAQFFLGEACDMQDICIPPPTGCCISGSSCTINTGDGCDTFIPGETCDSAVCIPDAPQGCCPDPGGDGCTITTQDQCSTQLQFGLMCNDQGTCGPLGCCQRAAGECAVTLEADCPMEVPWFESVSCTQSGVCENLVQGCCQLSPDACSDSTDCPPEDFFEGESCLPDDQCGPVTNGCCQGEDGTCTETTVFECEPDLYTPDLFCIDGRFCGTQEGCCICGEADCSIISPEECNDMPGDCKYLGDGTNCEGEDICDDTPGCCFLDGQNGEPDAVANSRIDPEKCEETTATECSEIGGEFQGIGTSCREDFPEECKFPPRNVPSLSQWGLIAMAGLLGLFSLYVIARRHKYNVS